MVSNGYAFGMILFNLSVTAALTLGAVISGSSTAIVTAVLRTQRRINENMADTTILVTIIEDIG